MKPTRWTADEWATMNLILMDRAGGACERCGKECGPVERHHRMRRREGGDSLANLVLVGRECHRQIHAHPVKAREQGFIVPTYGDPETTPVMWRQREWFVLDNAGGKHGLPVPA